jgi:hypothetical protein
MPTNYPIKNAKLWGSILPESAYNTAFDENTEFQAITSRENIIIMPTVDKFDDAGQVGTGSHFASQVCNDYWTQPSVALDTQLDYFGFFGRLWLRAFGGTVATAAAGDGYKHTANLQVDSDGDVLPATDLIGKLGPIDALLAGMVVGQATISRQRQGRATLGFNLVGSGKHLNPHGIAALPAYTPPSVCGADTIVVKYTNPSSVVVDLGASGCQFVDMNVTLNNNLLINDRCPGDSSLTQNGGTANYMGRVPRQDQALDSAISFLLNEDPNEYELHLANSNVTSVVIAIRGALISTGVWYECGVEIPKANFRAIAPSENQGKAAYQLQIQPLYDSGASYIARGYVTNTVAANFK